MTAPAQDPAHVLVLTGPGDLHADRVCGLLRARGVRVTVFDPADLPARARMTVGLDPAGRPRRVLHQGTDALDLADVTAVWVRKPGRPGGSPDGPDPVARLVAGECAALADGVWAGLACPTFPAPRAVLAAASSKLAQLELAGRLGFTLPDTLVTTDPDELLDFWDRHEGGVISKALDSPSLPGQRDALTRVVEPVTAFDVGAAPALTACPVIVQAEVAKRLELRVTVVGNRVFAAEIHSQQSNHTQLDWRCYDTATTRHAVHRLPEPVRRRCLALLAGLGLRYGAIDLIVTPDDRYVFLEVNPTGQWLWIEDATDLPLSDAIADELTSLATRAPAATAVRPAVPPPAPPSPATRPVPIGVTP